LVTEYTSFVAVDSLAIADVSEEVPDLYNEFDQAGNPLPINLVGLEEVKTVDIDIIQIIGANLITKEKLDVKIDDIGAKTSDKLVLRLVDIKGAILLSRELSLEDLKNIISLNIGELSNQNYFLTLSINDEVIDTERFMIVK